MLAVAPRGDDWLVAQVSASGAGFGKGFGFRVEGLGFRVQGSGFRV